MYLYTGMGCDSATTAPAVYKALAARPACAPVADKMKYFMGHSHCNVVTEVLYKYVCTHSFLIKPSLKLTNPI